MELISTIQVLAAISPTPQASDNVADLVTVLIILLLVATGVALITRRLRIPYVSGLVLAGLAIAEFLPERVGLNPALILNLFLPILIFEAAINTDISHLRSTLKPIAILAGPGVILASGVTGILLKLSLGLVWIPALFAGVILSITDTVSVIAVFKEVTVPSRLITIVEGESLFNDGIALVLFSLIATAATGSLTIPGGIQQLLVVITGGAIVGLGVGYLSIGLLRRSDDPLSNMLLTVAIALGANQLGHIVGVSGAVAVVVAGLVVGNLGLSQYASASTKVTLRSFWEYAGFGVNTFIFLLIGLEINLTTLWHTLPAVLLTVVIYQTGRLLSVYPLLTLLQFFDRPIPLRWQHVLFLGNIKGSLSMALALTLPSSLPNREGLIALVFGVVLVSVIGQGLSLPWLVKRLKLSSVPDSQHQLETLQLQLIASKAAQDELDTLLKAGLLPKAVYEELRASYQARVAASERTLRDLYNRRSHHSTDGKASHRKLDAVRRRLLLAEKGAVSDAFRKRVLSEDVVQTYLKDLDEKLLSLEDD